VRLHSILLPGAVVLLVVALFAPVLGFGYVWDDHIYVGQRPVDIYFSYWLEHGREPFALSANYFRPVAYASLWFDLTVGDGSARAFHLSNLALHLVNTLLVGLLARRLAQRGGSSVAATIPTVIAMLAYGAHPALVETVAWISCRFDLLATLCVLLLLYVDLAWPRRRALPLMALLFAAALLSKESSIGLLASWPFWVLATRTGDGDAGIGAALRRMAPGIATLLVALASVFALRWLARGHVWLAGDIGFPDFVDHAWLVAATLGQALRLVLLPFGSAGQMHLLPGFPALSLLLPLGIFLLWILAWHRWRQLRPALLLTLAGLALFAPLSNLLPAPLPAGIFIADRYLTLPLAPMAIAAGLIAGHLSSAEVTALLRRGLALAGCAWLLAALFTVSALLPQWRSDASYWQQVLADHPGLRLAQNNLAQALVSEGRVAEAEALLERLLVDRRNDVTTLHNLARLRLQQRRPQAALDLLDRALAVDGGNTRVMQDRAAALAGLGRTLEAEALLREQVLTRDPGLREAHLYLVRLLAAQGRNEEARRHVDDHPEIFSGPGGISARKMLGGD